MKKKVFAISAMLIIGFSLAVSPDFMPVLAQYSWTDTIKIYENITVVYTNIRTITNNETFPVDVKAYVTSTSEIHLLQYYELSANGTDFVIISEGAVIRLEDTYYGLGPGQKLCFSVKAKPTDSVVVGDTATVGIKVELYPAIIYAQFTLTTLYLVKLDLNGTFVYGNSLKVRFYSYSGIYEGEVTVWSGKTPAYVTLSMNVSHPLNWPVENATLVLTDDLGTILQTVTTFVVHRSDLMGRLGELDYLWTVPSADRSAIMKEYVAIDGQWPYAPS